jgi:hypothetical protein
MGITDIEKRIDKLEESLNDKEKFKEKKFKFPFGKKVGRGQKKKNFVTVLVINENGNYNFKKYQIIDQTFIHDLIPRLAGAGYVIFDKKGNPLIILPNWSVNPFSPLEHYNKSLIDGSNTAGYKLLMAKMQKETVNSKKPVGKIVPWIIGIGLAGIVIYAILTGGGN